MFDVDKTLSNCLKGYSLDINVHFLKLYMFSAIKISETQSKMCLKSDLNVAVRLHQRRLCLNAPGTDQKKKL